MSTDPILVLSLIGMIAALVAIRLTFRNAASVRDAVMSPAVFAVCGALIGISVGMIWLSDREGRVTIDKGMLLLFCGASLGALVGAGARNVYPRLNRSKTATLVIVMMLLGASVGSPLGWIVGSMDEMHDQGIRIHKMLLGLAIGSSIGLSLGLFEVSFRRGAT